MKNDQALTAEKLFEFMHEPLRTLYDASEARSVALHALWHVMGLPHGTPLGEVREQVTHRQRKLATDVLERLKKFEPLQYIIGQVRFYGLDLRVTSQVLIPRPETEELVHLIVEKMRGEKGLRVLDLGTGSGCIAVALARNLAGARVTGIDLSPGALEVAAANARLNNADVEWVGLDLLREEPAGAFDVIVSNPPYISAHDKGLLARHITGSEPHRALFVEGRNPLLFYERIVSLAQGGLMAAGGTLFFEINSLHGSAVSRLLADAGFSEIRLVKDLSGNDRIVCGVKK